MSKVYEYNGKYYCDEDISIQLAEENNEHEFGGDAYDLFWDMKQEGQACEMTYYYVPECPEHVYESAEELVKEECDDFVVADSSKWIKSGE